MRALPKSRQPRHPSSAPSYLVRGSDISGATHIVLTEVDICHIAPRSYLRLANRRRARSNDDGQRFPGRLSGISGNHPGALAHQFSTKGANRDIVSMGPLSAPIGEPSISDASPPPARSAWILGMAGWRLFLVGYPSAIVDNPLPRHGDRHPIAITPRNIAFSPHIYDQPGRLGTSQYRLPDRLDYVLVDTSGMAG